MWKWFEYDVIKKMTMQIMTKWSKMLIWSTLFETELLATEVGKFRILRGEMGWWVLFAVQALRWQRPSDGNVTAVAI